MCAISKKNFVSKEDYENIKRENEKLKQFIAELKSVMEKGI